MRARTRRSGSAKRSRPKWRTTTAGPGTMRRKRCPITRKARRRTTRCEEDYCPWAAFHRTRGDFMTRWAMRGKLWTAITGPIRSRPGQSQTPETGRLNKRSWLGRHVSFEAVRSTPSRPIVGRHTVCAMPSTAAAKKAVYAWPPCPRTASDLARRRMSSCEFSRHSAGSPRPINDDQTRGR